MPSNGILALLLLASLLSSWCTHKYYLPPLPSLGSRQRGNRVRRREWNSGSEAVDDIPGDGGNWALSVSSMCSAASWWLPGKCCQTKTLGVNSFLPVGILGLSHTTSIQHIAWFSLKWAKNPCPSLNSPLAPSFHLPPRAESRDHSLVLSISVPKVYDGCLETAATVTAERCASCSWDKDVKSCTAVTPSPAGTMCCTRQD